MENRKAVLTRARTILILLISNWDGNVGSTGGEGYWDSSQGDHTLNWGPHCYANYTGSDSSLMYNHGGERQRPNRTNPSPMFISKKIGASLEFLHFCLHQKLPRAKFFGI
jgi:hypothetical protein